MGIVLESAWALKYQYRRYGKDEEEPARQDVFRTIARSRECRYISGEADDKLFDRLAFKESVDRALSRGGIFKLIFHRTSERDEAIKSIAAARNAVMMRLKRQWDSQFQLYHRIERSVYHFAVFDSRELMIEAPHSRGEPRLTEFWVWPSKAQQAKQIFDAKLENGRYSEVSSGELNAS